MTTRFAAIALAAAAVLTLAACSDDDDAVSAGAGTDPTASTTTVPSTTSPPAVDPPVTPPVSPPDSGGGDGDAPVTSPPAPPPPVDPPPGDENPDEPQRRMVEPTPGLQNPSPTYIESYASPSETKLELRFTTGVAECYGLDRVEIVEESESVTVTIFTGTVPGERMCIEIAESVATVVTLEQPLGARTVIDGSTGEPVPVD